jgi:hypothetical protein
MLLLMKDTHFWELSGTALFAVHGGPHGQKTPRMPLLLLLP